MTKKELIQRLAGETGVAQKQVEGVLAALFRAIHQEERTAIPGFGIFKWVVRAARAARNPTTGEAVAVPEKKVLTFKASK